MIKEPKDVDFMTTGRQPSDADFARISKWIEQDKAKQGKRTRTAKGRKNIAPRTELSV